MSFVPIVRLTSINALLPYLSILIKVKRRVHSSVGNKLLRVARYTSGLRTVLAITLWLMTANAAWAHGGHAHVSPVRDAHGYNQAITELYAISGPTKVSLPIGQADGLWSAKPGESNSDVSSGPPITVASASGHSSDRTCFGCCSDSGCQPCQGCCSISTGCGTSHGVLGAAALGGLHIDSRGHPIPSLARISAGLEPEPDLKPPRS